MVGLTLGADDTTLAEIGAGEVLGELSAVDGFPRSASATATTDVDAAAIPIEWFSALLGRDPRLGLYMLRTVASRLRRSTEERTIGVGGLPLRDLANVLVSSIADPGTRELRVSVPELAVRLGVNRELLSRSLEELVRRDAVTVDRGRVGVIDPIMLGGIAEFDKS